MFGVSRNKKKQLATIRTAASSSDDDYDEEHRRRNLGQKRDKKSKKKKIKTSATSSAGLSFDPQEEEHDANGAGLLDVSSSSKKRKKHARQHDGSEKSSPKKSSKRNRGGFGYGGGNIIPSDESASDAEQNQDQNTTTSSQYDVAALQRLKMEQKHGSSSSSKVFGVDSNHDDNKQQSVEQQEEVNMEHTAHVETEEEFIPLADTKPKHNRRDPIVLTGDEALAFAEKEEEEEEEDPSEFDHGLQSQPKQMKPETTKDHEQIEEEVEEGNRQWEDTMARRAGILPSTGISQQSDARHSHHHYHRNKVKSNYSSLADIKGSLQSTVNNLENVSSDLATSIQRQQSAITSTKDELTKHQSTLENHGKALEYYQGLRVDLATWMGALRELDSMVSLAEKALHRWEVDVTWKKLERFFEWGKDCTSVLEKHGLLESKITCNDNIDSDQAPEVDEFGRVVSSKATIERIKRLDRRQKMQSQRLEMHPNLDSDISSSSCINEDNFDVSEVDEWKQRHNALNDAVALIPNSVKDNYRSIGNLSALFDEWQRLHPEDYETSFAEMSFVKMASVLVRMELCQRWDLLGLSRSIDGEAGQHVHQVSESGWFKCFKSGDRTSFTQRVLLQIIEKEIVARFLRSLSFYDETNSGESTEHLYGVYNPFSIDQTRHLCTFLKSLLGYLSTEETESSNRCEKTIESVSCALLSLVKKCIGRMTIPVINPSNVKREKNRYVTKDGAIEFDNETNDAIAYASVVQAKELCTLVTNIFLFWYPQIGVKAGDLLKFVFSDIISQRIIPLVQTTSNECNCDLGKTIIGGVLDAASGLLDDKEWMLQAAPLRVAAQTMGL